jgi:hypothetical protein
MSFPIDPKEIRGAHHFSDYEMANGFFIKDDRMNRFLATATLIGATLLAFSPGHADEASVDRQIESLLGDAADYKELFYAFKVALEEGKSDIVVSLVNYPLTVSMDGEEATYASEQELLDDYDSVFTETIMEAVSNQEYGDLFVNSEGVMIGNGEVWITGICEDSACTTALPRIMTIQSGN